MQITGFIIAFFTGASELSEDVVVELREQQMINHDPQLTAQDVDPNSTGWSSFPHKSCVEKPTVSKKFKRKPCLLCFRGQPDPQIEISKLVELSHANRQWKFDRNPDLNWSGLVATL